MKKMILSMALLAIANSAFAFEATTKTLASATVESIFSTAMSSITLEISSFSTIEAQKVEARKILKDIQEYNQTSAMTLFVAGKISIIQNLDQSLSIEESVDVLIEVCETILAK